MLSIVSSDCFLFTDFYSLMMNSNVLYSWCSSIASIFWHLFVEYWWNNYCVNYWEIYNKYLGDMKCEIYTVRYWILSTINCVMTQYRQIVAMIDWVLIFLQPNTRWHHEKSRRVVTYSYFEHQPTNCMPQLRWVWTLCSRYGLKHWWSAMIENVTESTVTVRLYSIYGPASTWAINSDPHLWATTSDLACGW